jgi:hypothetical protein
MRAVLLLAGWLTLVASLSWTTHAVQESVRDVERIVRAETADSQWLQCSQYDTMIHMLATLDREKGKGWVRGFEERFEAQCPLWALSNRPPAP